MSERVQDDRQQEDSGETLEVLHVDGDRQYLETVADRLEAVDEGLAVHTETTAASALDRLDRDGVDCLLTETAPPGTEPLQLVAHLDAEAPDLPVVVVDDGLTDATAAAALERGAAEVMPRTTDLDGLSVLANRLRQVADDGGTPAASDDVLDDAPVGVWTLRGGTVTYANRACASLFGREPGDLVGTPVRELVAEGDRETVDAHVDALLSGDSEERTDVVTAFGRWNVRRELELRGCRVETEEGPVVVGGVVDATQARERGRRLRTLVEEIEQPVAEVAIDDGRAVVQAVNPAFEEAFGRDASALVDERLDEHVVPDEAALDRALDIYVRLERGTSVAEEVTRTAADGERTFRLQGLPFEAGGTPHAYLVYSGATENGHRDRDLAALQSVARELMGADDYHTIARIGAEAAERVLDTEVACVYGLDEGGEALVPLAATDGAQDLFGDLPVIARGEGAAWYVHEMGDPLVTDDVRSLDTIANPETDVRSEMLLPIDDHGVFVASSTAVGVFDETDEALARTLASTLEAAFNRAEKDQLLRERERELLRENERLDEFAGIVSHDLRSPLAVVKGNVSLLRDEGDPQYLERIDTAADRMETLIEDLLSLARQGSMVEQPEFVDLSAVVKRAWTTADTKAATLEADLDVTIKADRSRLRQLLENLVNNAVEHGGHDATVRVGTIEADPDERPGGQYGRDIEGFYVEDDGPGLPEDVDDFFEPGTTTRDDGTGFGLAIVNRIAEAHGWDVAATESAEGGARFEFTGVEGT